MTDTLSPARLDQFVETRTRQVIVDADSCAIVKDLKAIDPSLNVRFVDGPEPYFAVIQDLSTDDRKDEHLVTTVQAHPTSFGTYTGLDNRLVERIRKITHPSYDFSAEAERQKAEWDEARRKEREEVLGEAAERAAHALRQDLGVKTKAFIK